MCLNGEGPMRYEMHWANNTSVFRENLKCTEAFQNHQSSDEVTTD